MVWERLPATLMLTITALVIWVTVGHRHGGLRRREALLRVYDQGMTFLSYILYSLPTFWLGLMLIFLFGPALHLLPTGGVVDARDWPAFGSPQFWAAAAQRPVERHSLDIGTHLILPVVTLVAVNIAADSRFVRASMLETLSADFVRTARPRAWPRRRVVGRHAFRNAHAAGDHERRPRDALPGLRRHRDRDDLQLAGHRPPLHRVGRGARLLRAHGASSS